MPERNLPELRPYQHDVIDECRQQFLVGPNRICIVAPTGSGKTVIGAEIIRQCDAADMNVLVIGHTREIVTQASQKFHSFNVAHGIIMAEQTMRGYHGVQIASQQTYAARVVRSKRMEAPPADLLFVDECHHIRARTWQQIVDHYPGIPLIGLTATPCRGDGRGLGNVFDCIVECPQVPELIKLGYLVGTKTFAPAPPDLRGVKTQAGDYVAKQLGQRMNNDGLVGDIVTQWLKHANGLTTVVFAVDVAHSRHIASEFLKAGIKAEHVDGMTPKRARDAILKRLASGKTTVVSNCMVLIEGFDLPDIGCLVLARPTKQMGLYRQMIGRGLRPAEGKDKLVVLDHSGAIYHHGPVEDEVEWTLHQDKRAINKRHDAKKKILDGDGIYRSRLVDCTGCSAKRMSGEACIHCGFYPQRPPRAVLFDDGDLALYDRAARRAGAINVDPEQQIAWHGMLLWINRDRGFKFPGWASNKFREKFGHWPPYGKLPEMRLPSRDRAPSLGPDRRRGAHHEQAQQRQRQTAAIRAAIEGNSRLPSLAGNVAWRSLYVALKRRYNRDIHNNGRIYLAQRTAAEEIGSDTKQVTRWFRELEHYGFIVMISGGCLGVDGKGQAPRWRLTELGYMKDPPARDFMRWKPGNIFTGKKQNPVGESTDR